MAGYEAFRAGLFRRDKDDRRVLAPRGSRGTVYLVPDDAVDRIARGIYRGWLLTIAVVVASLLLTARSGYWLLGIVAAAIASRVYSKWLVGSLAPAGVSVADLKPIDSGSRRTATRAAFGRRHYLDLGIAGAFIALLGVAVLVIGATSPQQEGRTMVSSALLAVFGIYLVVSSFRALRELRISAHR